VYLVKHVLHNWGDERALSLLRCCVDAMAPGGRVLVIETVLSPTTAPTSPRSWISRCGAARRPRAPEARAAALAAVRRVRVEQMVR
jgi:hypothetical protein